MSGWRDLRSGWLVLALALFFGAALAGVHRLLAARIAANVLHETLSQIPALVPGADGGAPVDIRGRTVYRAEAAGRTLGWVVPSGGQGFADRIDLLIGLDADGSTLTGLYILGQKETPGLGNKIIEEPWRGQFRGKSTGQPLVVKKGDPSSGNEIRSVTGATISAESVCGIVNQTVAEMQAALAQATREEPDR
ncbi:MAG: FMN-binding protein [Candidatus Eisenbacteria bacterium]|uniref:Ion-translocating oxidoreductase complex subunit G n=1 Tax=Eiseniibacteriota bacterium TaxID=2212470 RepID=A0A938BMU2_UNCEI|nr:FMN-binding protein [Candidatus Eisenbacteria bacterium]